MSTCLATPDPIVKRSGGPRTAEGKEASRRNALKRGLRSKIVFPDDVEALVEQRTRDFIAEFAPASPYENVLVRDMAVSSVRIERCASLSVADLVRVADRAEFRWEYDRRMSVEDYAVKLPKDPERIAFGLRRTRQGTDFLIEHWDILRAIAREIGRWDDDQRRLAFDMLGIAHELRNTTIDVPAGDDAPRLIALADAQITMLREEQESILDDMDDAERAMAMAGMPVEEDATTMRLRKDESRARTDFAKARKELLRHRAEKTQEKSKAEPESTSDRPAPSSSTTDRPAPSSLTSDYFVTRSRVSMRAAVENPIKEPAIVEITAREVSTPNEQPRSRRARKELQRRARAAARKEAATR